METILIYISRVGFSSSSSKPISNGTIPTCQIQTPAFLVFIGNSFDLRTEAIELFNTWAQSIKVWKKYREKTGVHRFFQNSTEIGSNEEKQLKYVYIYIYTYTYIYIHNYTFKVSSIDIKRSFWIRFDILLPQQVQEPCSVCHIFPGSKMINIQKTSENHSRQPRHSWSYAASIPPGDDFGSTFEPIPSRTVRLQAIQQSDAGTFLGAGKENDIYLLPETNAIPKKSRLYNHIQSTLW